MKKIDSRSCGKIIPAFFFFFLSCTIAPAQTLFTCDNRPVSKEEFLKAFNKNNTNEKTTERSYRDYLELYIRYKLKVRAAYDLKLDTLQSQATELLNFRSQVAENYMNEEETMNALIKEVFSRGQKELRLSHIFIALPKDPTPADTLRAYEKAIAAWGELKKKKGFGETALAFSEDPSVRTNKGEVGTITVFTLSYELEGLAYSLAPGQFSRPYRTRSGYHIFLNMGEKKARGKIKVAHILLPVQPDAPENVRESARLKADSIYSSLLKGADFSQQAKLYSGDNLSYQNGGELPEFGAGKYDPVFEEAAFSLEKDGAISRPVKSSYGYHIIKRLGIKPFPPQFNKEVAAILKQQVSGDARVEVSRKALFKKIYQQAELKRFPFAEDDLAAFTDSVVRNRPLSSYRGLSLTTMLFSFTRQSYTVKDWLDYVRAVRANRPALATKTYPELFGIYMESAALDYYRNHLESYNPDFAFQLTEFREGNLLFEIMQRKIWDKASTDSAGLRNYYEAHKDKYSWEASADALLFTCNNEKIAQDLKSGLSRNISDWKKLADSAGAAVQADSGRFELGQIPAKAGSPLIPRQFTTYLNNPSDNTVSFAYILNVYQEKSPRNYRDARGFVINDYQLFLEDEWIKDLKKKYPVNVDEKVFATLPK